MSANSALQPGQGPEAKLTALGHALPTPPNPVAAYVPSVRTGNLLYVAGQIPLKDGKLLAQGRVGNEVSMDLGRQCAVQCALNGLAIVKAAAGSLDAVARVVRVGCFVCCEAGFHDQPKIANGASELLVAVFGEAGRHARAAVGSIDLPLGAPVEVEFLFELKPV